MKLIANLNDVDRKAVEAGLSGVTLMGRAGEAVADVALEVAGGLDDDAPEVWVLCGPGNNGGDGFVAAGHLARTGLPVTVWTADTPKSADALHYFKQLKSARKHQAGVCVGDPAALMARPAPAVIVDALFGSGLSRPVTGVFASWIAWINQARQAGETTVLSVDVPSGLDSATGQVHGAAVLADATLTFQVIKPGLYLAEGKACAGSVMVADIGLPPDLIDADPSRLFALSAPEAAARLPVRAWLGHKYTFGSVLVVGGCVTMPGAVALCAEAALTAGSGVVRAAMAEPAYATVTLRPELLRLPLGVNDAGYLRRDNETALRGALEKTDVVAVGPGLGRHADSDALLGAWLDALVSGYAGAVVLDADALNVLSQSPRTLDMGRFVLTPHLGEAARLLAARGLPDQLDVLLPETLIAAARNLAAAYQAVVILKSATTIVSDGDQVWINPVGNNGMATAGSGDVLAGVLAGLLAQNARQPKPLPLVEAAALAAYLHGFSGDMAAQALTPYALCAGDIARWLPEAFKELLG